jgi:anthranilate/para-aminobenzoate synthase component I
MIDPCRPAEDTPASDRGEDDVLEEALLGAVASGSLHDFAWADGGGLGRSFIGAWPSEQIESDDWSALERVHERWQSEPNAIWIGWLTYEFGVDRVLCRRSRGSLPGAMFRRFGAALEQSPTGLRCHGGGERLLGELLRQAPLEGGHRLRPHGRARLPDEWPFAPLEAVWSPETYREGVLAAQRLIAAGETYQVNLSQVLRGAWRRELDLRLAAARTYATLRGRFAASMGALIDYGPQFVLSNSPETLLDVRLGEDDGRDVARSWPIKGTRPRGCDPFADRAAAERLLASAKDVAEHVMIVDLVRNDLGRLAVPGTVRAPAVPDLMTLPTVHHLVSEVRATLRPGTDLPSLFAAVFPAGSITGAPKRRTVEIIDALEGEPRGIYCGCIVVLEPRGLRASVAIRTATLDAKGLTVRVGGGIVIDSDPEEERLETLAKARAFDPSRVDET